jgi:hypothetical protein
MYIGSAPGVAFRVLLWLDAITAETKGVLELEEDDDNLGIHFLQPPRGKEILPGKTIVAFYHTK